MKRWMLRDHREHLTPQRVQLPRPLARIPEQDQEGQGEGSGGAVSPWTRLLQLADSLCVSPFLSTLFLQLMTLTTDLAPAYFTHIPLIPMASLYFN